MKKVFIAIALCSASISQAQVGVQKTDSIEMGAGYLNEVYYLLKDGSTKVEPTNNWHIAFRTGGQTDGIRINSATVVGANEGTVSIYIYPNGALADWATMDTSGYRNWMMLHNSDKSWEIGALNTTAGQFPDFGWGVYNMSSHIVTGDSIYLVKYKLAGVDVFKKLYIERKQSSTWYFKYADIDGNNEVSAQMSSADFAGRNYIYYNFETRIALNREPENWDFTLTRYAALQNNGTYFPSTRILTNIGVKAAKALGKEANDLTLADSTTDGLSSDMNILGYDWKHYEIGPGGVVWYTEDSLAYFVEDSDKVLWKVVFTAFGGSSNGKTVFNKTQLTPSVSVRQNTASVEQTSLYPNPTNGKATIVVSANNAANASVRVLDINGRLVQQYGYTVASGLQLIDLNLSDLPNGVYFIQVNAEGFQSTDRLVKF